MTHTTDHHPSRPTVEVQDTATMLSGSWNLRGLATERLSELRAELGALADDPARRWDLRAIDSLDLTTAVPIANFWIGLAKGVVFGGVVALTACHFGLRILPNTQSLGAETTNSVVTSIALVILMDAVFAILFQGVGVQ